MNIYTLTMTVTSLTVNPTVGNLRIYVAVPLFQRDPKGGMVR